jgi:hypothetical protein
MAMENFSDQLIPPYALHDAYFDAMAHGMTNV